MIKLLLFKIIFLTFFQIIKTFYATLKVYVDDYIDLIRVDYNSITDGDDLINRKINSIEKNFEVDYDSKIEIQISNYKEHFGLSAKLSFNNGIKEEIYSTNDIWLWSTNDTRGFTEIYEYTKTTISESNIIGSYDQRIENCERCYTYLYTLIITGIVRCYNINAIKVKVGEERGINLPDLISSKAEKKSDIYFKIISDFKGKIYGENGEEIKKNIEYPVQILKYTTEYYNNLDILKYKLTYDSTTISDCKIELYTCSQICKNCELDDSKIKCLDNCNDDDDDDDDDEDDEIEYYFSNNECKKIPNGKYYNSTNYQIEDCYLSCEKCHQYGDENNNNCDKCNQNEGYYNIKNVNQKNCYKNPDGYYFDSYYKQYIPCGNNCSKCTFENSKIKCSKCIDNYYFIENNFEKCYKSISGYYLDGDIFKKCYSSCKECTNEGSFDNSNCKINECSNNAFPLENDLTQCYLENNIPEGYSIKNSVIIKCYDYCKRCYDKFNNGLMNCNECIDGYYKLEDKQSECYQSKIGYYFNNSDLNNIFLGKCYIYCQSCSKGFDNVNNKMNCDTCIDNYYYYNTNCLSQCDNDLYYNGNNCVDECNNYYYEDSNNKKYCIESCNDIYPYLITTLNKCVSNCEDNNLYYNGNNCVNECNNYYYEDSNNKKYCIESCNEIYPYLIPLLNKCVSNCEDNDLYIEDNKCISTCSIGYTLKHNKCEKNTNYIPLSLDETIEDLPNLINNIPSNTQINGNDFSFEIIKTNEKYNIKSNLSIIYLDKCETILRKQYSISDNDYLIITKFDIVNSNSDSLTGQLIYKVYNSKGKELDLSYCSDIKIKIEYPISNSIINLTYAEMMSNSNVDIFNPKDKYFNNICEKSIGNNSDLTMNKKREVQYINISICENDCEYKGINYTIMKAICECLVDYDYTDNDNDIKNQFKNAFSNSIPKYNIIICKCYSVFFHFKNIMNIGFWFYFILILIDIFLFVHYLLNGFVKLRALLYKMIIKKKNLSSPPKFYLSSTLSSENINLENEKHAHSKINNKIINKYEKSSLKPISNENLISNQKDETHLNNNKNKKNNFNKSLKKISFSPKKNSYVKEIKNEDIIYTKNETEEKIIELNLLDMIGKKGKIIQPSKYKTVGDILVQKHKKDNYIIKDDDDINNIPYFLAKRIDKRNFKKMFLDTFLLNLALTNTFQKNSNFDLLTVKITAYLTTLSIDFWLNAIFYTDSIVDEKFDNGNISFITEYLKSFYSCLVGVIFSSMLQKLSIYTFYFDIISKETHYSVNFLKICDKFIYRVKKQLFIFFIFNFIFMLWMLYYCTIFCYIYNHNQFDWFKGGWYSFFISILTTIIISFIISLIRFISINKEIKYLYNVSSYLSRFA